MELRIYLHNIMHKLNVYYLMEFFPLCFAKSIVMYTLPSRRTILLYSTIHVTCFGLYDHVQTSIHIIINLSRCVKNVLQYIFNVSNLVSHYMYEGWNFNFGNAAVTFDTVHLQSSYFHRPSMYSPKLCRTRSQR